MRTRENCLKIQPENELSSGNKKIAAKATIYFENVLQSLIDKVGSSKKTIELKANYNATMDKLLQL